ncbi:PhoPQ-activated pathogenicity-related family protein [Nibrella saemangeumensis]|uniref:PhoPQ-activated pathogenicity-related family protein n=2 Tax=Nibrella saemangeumensis TaxID=1084526 RepID=A0ABP8NLL2_9BACT
MLTVLCTTLFFFGFDATHREDTNPANALEHYLNNGDKSFQWEVKDSFDVGDIRAYNLLLTSQKWREHTWRHQLTVLVPKENNHDGALLFITGGSNKSEQPNWSTNKGDAIAFGAVAAKNKAIVAVLRQTPNQPFYDNLTEDALISYTLHNFRKDNDYTWPLLFPMVKSAVRGMDAVQEFAKQNLNHTVNRFVVSGASKRGWTTWLTGAMDSRAVAIAPMVIDILNMPKNLKYQIDSWNKYSEQIQDYVALGLTEAMTSPGGRAINQMIDPYSYRKKLTQPKMIFMGTNDEYWTVDAIKHYYDDIPGQNLIHYVPNAGHGLGDKRQALEGLSAFFGTTMLKQNYPVCQWNASQTKEGVKLSVKTTPDLLEEAIVWSADSDDKIFQDEKWESRSLGARNQPKVEFVEPYPTSGYKAFYVDLKYKAPNGGTYTESTRMFLTDNDEVFLK